MTTPESSVPPPASCVLRPASPQPPPTTRTVYGHKWPADPRKASDLAIELACYRDPAQYPTPHPSEHHLKRAMTLLWPDFQWNEWIDRLLWAWCRYRVITVIGHTRASKTYGTAHIAWADYIAGYGMTATSFTTTKFDALKQRLWGDLAAAIENMQPGMKTLFRDAFDITSTSNEMRVRIKPNGAIPDEKHIIQGIATDSADKTAGKLRGQHADRRRIIVDEAQDVAPAIYLAFANAMSAPDFKGILLSNPVEKNTEFGEWCEPAAGWETITDTTPWWETKKGGVCLHFDGLQSPNIKAGKTLYPFLLTQDYINDIRRNHGEDSLEWWMYVRGYFPPEGTVARVWNTQAIETALTPAQYDYPPTPVASLDPAFEHDECILIIAATGKLRDGRHCTTATACHSIKTKQGPGHPEKERQVADQVMTLCKTAGVRPENFIMDTTGNDRSVYAILKSEWGKEVHWLDYGGKATTRPLRHNDPKPAAELVKYFVSELWFRAAYAARDGLLRGLDILGEKARSDLSARRYKIVKGTGAQDTGDLMQAETKREMKTRLGRSPDRGDAYCQLAELMARKNQLTPATPATKTLDQWKSMMRQTRSIRLVKTPSDDTAYTAHHW